MSGSATSYMVSQLEQWKAIWKGQSWNRYQYHKWKLGSRKVRPEATSTWEFAKKHDKQSNGRQQHIFTIFLLRTNEQNDNLLQQVRLICARKFQPDPCRALKLFPRYLVFIICSTCPRPLFPTKLYVWNAFNVTWKFRFVMRTVSFSYDMYCYLLIVKSINAYTSFFFRFQLQQNDSELLFISRKRCLNPILFLVSG